MNAEKILAVEDTTYAVAKFNFMTSSQLGGSITSYNTGLGSESGSMPGFIFFFKECFFRVNQDRVRVRVRVSVMVRARVSVNHNPNPNLKTAFFYKKRYTPIPIPIPTPRFTDTRPSWGSGFESRQPKLWRWVVKSLCNLRILFSSSKTSKGTPFQTTSAKFG